MSCCTRVWQLFSISLIEQKQGTSMMVQGTGIDEIPAEFLKF